MYVLLVALSAFLIGVSEILKLKFHESIFSSWKAQWFWDWQFHDKQAAQMSYLTIEYKVRWYHQLNAHNLSLWLNFFFLIVAAAMAQLPAFQIKGFPVFYQILCCAVIYVVIYNYTFHKLFRKKP